MIMGSIFAVIAAAFWLNKSYTRWPNLFGFNDFVFAAFLASSAFMGGYMFETVINMAERIPCDSE